MQLNTGCLYYQHFRINTIILIDSAAIVQRKLHSFLFEALRVSVLKQHFVREKEFLAERRTVCRNI